MMLKHRLGNLISDRGLLLTVLLSLAGTFLFFGKLLIDPAHTYFGSSGDGLQIYYQTLYHIAHDTEYWRQTSINYPYGESIFFTGALPFITNLVKLFGPGAADAGVAVINLSMVLSVPLGAIFIYLIFRHLRMHPYYGAVCAAGIAFLSPQILRMSSHYSLAWVFLIPSLLYLLLRFYDFPSLKKSFVISFLVFLGASTHLYFMIFSAALLGMFWAVLFLTRDRGFGRILFVLKHFPVQFILPVVILQSLVMWSDTVPDRTHFPWGYLVYHSNNAGVFFPFGKPYEDFFRSFIDPEPVEWEGLAYVGLTAMAGLAVVLVVQGYRLLKRRFNLLLSVTDNKVLNIFFWTSLILLYLSYALPFRNGHEDWLLKLGPLSQFRAVGRLAWLFFYVANIIAVYRIYRLSLQGKKVVAALMWLAPAALYTDAYYHVKDIQDQCANYIPELEDKEFSSPQNAWMKTIRSGDYQAILPLSWFHNGSENYASQPADAQIVKEAYIVSYLLDLPLLAAHGSRLSLSQTFEAAPINLDPVVVPPVVHRLPDQRPLLLVVRDSSLRPAEQRILTYAKKLHDTPNYSVWALAPSAFDQLAKDARTEVESEMTDTLLVRRPDGLVVSSASAFVFRKWSGNEDGYYGKGMYAGKFRDYNVIYDSLTPCVGQMIISYWVKNFTDDRTGRTTQEIIVTDSTGKMKGDYTAIAFRLVALDGEWGLIESVVEVTSPKDRIKVTLWAKDRGENDLLRVDRLMIREVNTDIYRTEADRPMKNNRIYHGK